jgi:hypothetical protein
MPRKTSDTRVIQPIYLSPDVTVTIKAPKDKWPIIQWNGPFVSVTLAGSEAPAVSARQIEADTPDFLQKKAELEARFPKKVPYTTEDAMREAGWEGVKLPDLSTMQAQGEALEQLAATADLNE